MAQKKNVEVKAAKGSKTPKVKAETTLKKKAATAANPAAKKTSSTKTTSAVKSVSKAKSPSKSTKTGTVVTAEKKAPPAKKVAATKSPAKKTTAATKSAPARPAAKTAAGRTAASRSAAAKKRPAAASATRTAQLSRAAAKQSAVSPAGKKTNVKSVAAAASKPAVKKQQPNAAAKVEPKIVAPAAPKAKGPKHAGFKKGEYIVYPAHGVGQIVEIEEQEIAGMSLELFVIEFEKDKMTLRVPTAKLESMRKLAPTDVMQKAMTTLKGRARVKRTMWSRRAQEYEAKINSGDLVSIAEVVRDLYRSETQPEQSYSERQLYEAALDRMARELAAVEDLDERGAVQRITEILSKSAKGRQMAEEEASDETSDNSQAA